MGELVASTENVYSDLDLSFRAHPITGDIVRLTGHAAIKRALKNLVFTSFYDIGFEPQVGCGVRTLLFEPMTGFTEERISKMIEVAIANFEHRVKVREVQTHGEPDSNTYRIVILFTIVGTEIFDEVSFFLHRLS